MNPTAKQILDQRKIAKNPALAVFQALEEMRTEIGKYLMFSTDQTKKILAAELSLKFADLREELGKVAQSDLEGLKALLAQVKGNPGKDSDAAKVAAEVVAIIRADIAALNLKPGDPGAPGKTPTKAELKQLIKEVLPKPVKSSVKLQAPVSEERIVELIKSLAPTTSTPVAPAEPVEEEVIAVQDVTGLADELERLRKDIAEVRRMKKKEKGGGSGGGGDIIKLADLSGQTDGARLTFTVPKSRKAIMVVGSDFPSVLFEGNGFTLNGARTSLTLQVANAPSLGSQLGFQYVV